jgi:hypothetical protein
MVVRVSQGTQGLRKERKGKYKEKYHKERRAIARNANKISLSLAGFVIPYHIVAIETLSALCDTSSTGGYNPFTTLLIPFFISKVLKFNTKPSLRLRNLK